MPGQYSFLELDDRPTADPAGKVLAVDTGSPVISVAIGIDGEIAAEQSDTDRQSSNRLLELIDRCLQDAAIDIRDLDLLLGIRGPGSFTGLRVGLATLQGMQMALGARAATTTTFEVLASLGEPSGPTVVACVDALRDEWMVQEFSLGESQVATRAPRTVSSDALRALDPTCLVGFGTSRLRPTDGSESSSTFIEPGPLASQALRLLGTPDSFDWSDDCLSHPLYLSPPAAALPIKRG